MSLRPETLTPNMPSSNPNRVITGSSSFLLAWRLEGKEVLIVGGGKEASNRLFFSLDAGARVTLVSPLEGRHAAVTKRIDDGLVESVLNREFRDSDLYSRRTSGAPVDMILVCIDDPVESQRIALLARALRIPVNCADLPSICDFYFMAQYTCKELQIAVSTNGGGPRLGARIRNEIVKALDPYTVPNSLTKGRSCKGKASEQNHSSLQKRMGWISRFCDSWTFEQLASLSNPSVSLEVINSFKDGHMPSIPAQSSTGVGAIGLEVPAQLSSVWWCPSQMGGAEWFLMVAVAFMALVKQLIYLLVLHIKLIPGQIASLRKDSVASTPVKAQVKDDILMDSLEHVVEENGDEVLEKNTQTLTKRIQTISTQSDIPGIALVDSTGTQIEIATTSAFVQSVASLSNSETQAGNNPSFMSTATQVTRVLTLSPVVSAEILESRADNGIDCSTQAGSSAVTHQLVQSDDTMTDKSNQAAQSIILSVNQGVQSEVVVMESHSAQSESASTDQSMQSEINVATKADQSVQSEVITKDQCVQSNISQTDQSIQSELLTLSTTSTQSSLPDLSSISTQSTPLLQPMQRSEGAIYLVGAGPGAKEMLTIQAFQVLMAADLVVVDRLIPAAVYDFVPSSRIVLSNFKVGGASDRSQEEMNEVCLTGAQEGKMVARLKTGDPFVFARGGEEIMYFRSHGIEPKIVAGISSVFAAPSCNGFPITHRGTSDQVLVLSGRGQNGAFPEIPEYYEFRTTVILMSLSRLDELCTLMIQKQYPIEVSCAVIEKGTWAEGEKVCRGTLRDIVEKVKGSEIANPALLIVGNVVGVLDSSLSSL